MYLAVTGKHVPEDRGNCLDIKALPSRTCEMIEFACSQSEQSHHQLSSAAEDGQKSVTMDPLLFSPTSSSQDTSSHRPLRLRDRKHHTESLALPPNK